MSAAFAALTAIFAKLGVERINPDAATFLALSGLATGPCSWCYFRALHIGGAARAAPPMHHQLALCP